MSSVTYNFSYFVIPDSIYHFTYENFNSIKIVNDEFLLKRDVQKPLYYNENNLIKKERKITRDLYKNDNISFLNKNTLINNKDMLLKNNIIDSQMYKKFLTNIYLSNNIVVLKKNNIKITNNKRKNLIKSKKYYDCNISDYINISKHINEKLKTNNYSSYILNKNKHFAIIGKKNDIIRVFSNKRTLKNNIDRLQFYTRNKIKTKQNNIVYKNNYKNKNVINVEKNIINDVTIDNANIVNRSILNKYLAKNNFNINDIKNSIIKIHKENNNKIKLSNIDNIRYFTKSSKSIFLINNVQKVNKYFDSYFLKTNEINKSYIYKTLNKKIQDVINKNYKILKNNSKSNNIKINNTNKIKHISSKKFNLKINYLSKSNKIISKNIILNEKKIENKFSKFISSKIDLIHNKMLGFKNEKLSNVKLTNNIQYIKKYNNKNILVYNIDKFSKKSNHNIVENNNINKLKKIDSKEIYKYINNISKMYKENNKKIRIPNIDNIRYFTKSSKPISLINNVHKVNKYFDKYKISLYKEEFVYKNFNKKFNINIHNNIKIDKQIHRKIFVEKNINYPISKFQNRFLKIDSGILLKKNNNIKYINLNKEKITILNKSIQTKQLNVHFGFELKNNSNKRNVIFFNKDNYLSNEANKNQKIYINKINQLYSTSNIDKDMIIHKNKLLYSELRIGDNKANIKIEDIYQLKNNRKLSLKNNSTNIKYLNKNISKKISQIEQNKLKNNAYKNNIKVSKDLYNSLETTNRKIEVEKPQINLELYKTLWFIKGLGETDLKILPNIDYNYPALIDIFVEEPDFTYIFEYENTFKEFLNDNYTIELYDYDYNLISILSISQVKELETNNDVINLKIKEIENEENRFKFTIKIVYPKLNYIIIRQPVNEYMEAVLYTVTEKFLGENRHPIPFGNDLGIKEIPIHINIMVEFINILLLIWQHRFLAFSGQVGIHAIYGLVNLVYEWLTLETSQSAEYIEEYYRCFRWLRWEAEKVYNIAKADPKLNGNKWINFVINEMIDYMEMHHIDVMPILEDIRNTDDWRNWFTDPTFDIKFMLDKFKGERKRLSDNNYRLTSTRTI